MGLKVFYLEKRAAYINKRDRFRKLRKKFFKSQDYEVSKNFLAFIIFNGLLANIMVTSIFGVPFTWYSFIGYGILVYFIENKLISYVRQTIFR